MKTTRNTSKTKQKNEIYILHPPPDRGRVTQESWQKIVRRRSQIVELRAFLNEYRQLLEKSEQELENMQNEFFCKLENGAYLEGGRLTKDLSE